MSMAIGSTPLWPAGHLPLKGGDHSRHLIRSICKAESRAETIRWLISPFEGEMAGRPEGGDFGPSYYGAIPC